MCSKKTIFVLFFVGHVASISTLAPSFRYS